MLVAVELFQELTHMAMKLVLVPHVASADSLEINPVA